MKSSLLIVMLIGGSLIAAPVAAQDAALASTTTDDPGGVPSLTVEIAAPQTASWPERVRANGRLAAWHEASIVSEISGQRIERVLVDVGSEVKKGDVLVELSRTTIENDLRQQEATFRSAEAALEQATGEADGARHLSKSGAITQQELTRRVASERRAQADLAAAEARLDSLRLDLERTRITAVDDGTISSRSAALGSFVNAGQEMFRLIRQNRVEWQAELPLRQLQQIDKDTHVVIPSPWGDLDGTVRLIEPAASQQSGRIKVHVALTQPDDAPTPATGVLISGYFDLGDSEALSVPATAIVQDDGYSYVYVLEEGNRVRRQKVDTGRRLDERVEVTGGLTQELQVVQAGGAFLTDGALVRVSPVAVAASNGSAAQ